MTRVKTKFGDIFPTEGDCKDDYANISTFHNAAGQIMKLQEPAQRAWLAAELLNGRKLPWRKKRKPKAITITGEGWRSCSSQTALWQSDTHRFAYPGGSRHCRGLAVDCYNTATNLTPRAKRSLEACDWHFSVPGEPWHVSFHEVG